jgi:hypothetical protein
MICSVQLVQNRIAQTWCCNATLLFTTHIIKWQDGLHVNAFMQAKQIVQELGK